MLPFKCDISLFTWLLSQVPCHLIFRETHVSRQKRGGIWVSRNKICLETGFNTIHGEWKTHWDWMENNVNGKYTAAVADATAALSGVKRKVFHLSAIAFTCIVRKVKKFVRTLCYQVLSFIRLLSWFFIGIIKERCFWAPKKFQVCLLHPSSFWLN